jgi:hypothetical protein
MILQEFVFLKGGVNKNKQDYTKALEKLNKIKKDHENIYDDGIQPDCKCPYGDVDPKDCEDLCRLNHK